MPPPRDPPAGSVEALRVLVDSVLDYAIFTLDTDGRVASWNAGAHRIKGYTAEEIVGQHFRIFYTPEAQRDGHPEWELERVVTDGAYEEEGWRVRKDGTRFWANVVLTALRAPDGSLLGFGKVTRDLTERKAAEESLRDALRQLEESQARVVQQERLAAIGQLAAAVSHELRNPLGVISNALYLLRSGLESGGEQRLLRALATAEREVSSASLIVSDLLDYARSRAPELVEVDLAELLEEVLSVAPGPAGLRVSRHCPPGLVVGADRDQLRQVLLNLVMNAYDACGVDGRVELAATSGAPGWIVLTVSDDGAGIDGETAARVFEPFFTRKSSGTGLGLAVVQRIVEAHGGRVELESEPGRGATFTVALPAGRREAGAGRAGPTS